MDVGGYYYVWSDFWLDEEIVGSYDETLGRYRVEREQSYVFEIRSVFKLRRADEDDDDIYMGSERFAMILLVDTGTASWSDEEEEEEEHYKSLLPFYLSRARLGDDYRMPFDEIQTLALDALAFAKQTRHSAKSRFSWMEIPVVIELDVVTVQREGETVDEAMGRAIRPESLFPLHLCSYCWLTDSDRADGEAWPSSRKGFLKTLKRKSIRGFGPEAVVCPVCLRSSGAGDLMATLPCGHVCHALCVYQMLNEGLNDSCPTCAAPLPIDDDDDQT